MNSLAEPAVSLRRKKIPQTMRAAVIQAPGVVEMREAPIPVPGPGEVRIRLEGCGVCASNLTPWEGREWFTYPFAPGDLGHEGWGMVDAVGEGVTAWEPGQRVAALSYHAYAEYDVASASALVALPNALHGEPFPGEPLGCAMNIFARANIRAGDTVAIIGIGFLGALLTELASKAGARVIAIARRPWAQRIARQQGATHTIAMLDHSKIIQQVRELTNDNFCDVVIEATGKQWPLDLAAELTRIRGRLVIAGYHQDGPRQINMQLWNWRGLDVINAHERDPEIYISGIKTAVSAVVQKHLTPDTLYTHTVPLEQLGDVLNLTRDRPDGFMKALITLQ